MVWTLSLLAGLLQGLGAEVIFHLKNGDRLTGTILSETSAAVEIRASFGASVTLPSSQISRRETVPAASGAALAGASSTAAEKSSSPVTTAPAGPAPATSQAVVSQPAPAAKPAAAPPAPARWQTFLKRWDGSAELGVNLGFGTREHQTLTGRLRAGYVPRPVLRNNFDYLVSYGTTEGLLSENQMDGNWKIEHDIGTKKRFLVYNVMGAGYNEIQKIDLRYEVGPGVGYKWLMLTNYTLKSEFGGNYQQQFFSTGEDQQRYSLRLAEDMAWTITPRLKFDQRFEFFPQVEDFGDYRIRAEANLSYLLGHNLTFTLSVIDLYDTAPAREVSNNDLQIRSLIGVKF